MTSIHMLSIGRKNTVVVSLSDEERAREARLREYFARFWETASGEPRTIYDGFVAACPIAEGIVLEPVQSDAVSGWWVTPGEIQPGRAILFLHGGGYVQGSAKAYRGLVSQIVSRVRVPALVIDYPLAPEASLPAAPNAALAAWQWLIEQGFDRIAIIGDSAGGGLTLVTLAELTKHPVGPGPVVGVAFSPWADLTLSGGSMTDPEVRDPLIGRDYLQDCAGKYRGAVPAADPLASPLFGDLEGLPPILIQVGTDERLLDDSRRYAERAAKAGVPVQLEVWEGMHHVFQLDVARLESSRHALDRTARFLRGAFAS